MPIKTFVLKFLYRFSPGLRRVVEDRQAFADELGLVRSERDVLAQKLREQDANIEALNIAQQEINQSLIQKEQRIGGLLTEQKALLEKVAAAEAEADLTAAHLAETSQNALAARVGELTLQLKKAGNRDLLADLIRIRAQSVAVGDLPPSRRRAKFVVFSNPRSGSTWLETMLGMLPDAFVDYELKWRVTYTPSDIHAVLDENSQTISQLLEDMDTDASVTGSKFVFDIHGLTPFDFKELIGKIGPDVRIIHLTRSYRDIFLSVRRGYHHAPVRPEALTDRLRGALESADIRHASNGAASPVDPLTCFNELTIFLDNDIYIHSLKAAGFPYLQVSYDEVPARLGEIAAFAGGQPTPEIVADLLARPAVAKLPAFDGNGLVSNLAEIDPLFESFEVLKTQILAR